MCYYDIFLIFLSYEYRFCKQFKLLMQYTFQSLFNYCILLFLRHQLVLPLNDNKCTLYMNIDLFISLINLYIFLWSSISTKSRYLCCIFKDVYFFKKKELCQIYILLFFTFSLFLHISEYKINLWNIDFWNDMMYERYFQHCCILY